MSEGIHRLTKSHADAAARLHRDRISTGFLSSLGLFFLGQLYTALTLCDSGFGYVWQDTDGEVWGFVACAENTGRFYKQALMRRGLLLLLPLIHYATRPSVIKRVLETLRYPQEVKEELPDAEILSIAVSQQRGRKGIGKNLVKASLDEFTRRGIDSLKVAVWAGNAVANSFYLKCGFKLDQTRTHHGLPMNVYVIRAKEPR